MLDSLDQLKGKKTRDYGGKNLAPLKPLLQLKSSVSPVHHPLNDFIREVYQDCLMQDDQTWREILETGRTISNLRAGKLIMKRDPVFGGIAFLKPLKKNSTRRKVPYFQFYSTQLNSNWCNSNPDIDPVIMADDDRAEVAVSAIKQVHDHYERLIFDELYNQREGLSAQDYGTYITRFGYNERLRQMKLLKPIIENTKRTLFEGYGACLKCQFEGTENDFTNAQMQSGSPYPICPQCQSVDVITDPAVEIEASETVGHEEITVGDIHGDLLAFPACRYNMRKMAEDSEYFLYEQMIPVRMLKAMLGDIKIEGDGFGENYGLHILEQLGTRGGSIENLGANNTGGNYSSTSSQALMTELWLKPEMYADVTITGDEKTAGGEKLPKGAKMIEMFPEGCCAVGINGMDHIIGLYGECHSDIIVSGIYHLQSYSGVGKGVEDAVDIAKDMNSMHSQAMAYIERYATPSYGYVKDVISEADAVQLGNPTRNIPFDLAMAPEQMRSISQVVSPLTSGSPNQSLFLYQNNLNNMFQIAFGVTDFTDGLPGVTNHTATGAEIARDTARKHSVPVLKLKVEHRKRSGKVLINLFRKSMTAARWFAREDRFGIVKGKYISGADLPAHIEFEAVADSEVPRGEYDKRQDDAEMFAQAGGLPGFVQLAQISPRIAGWMAKRYKSDIPITNENEIGMICRARVDDIEKQADEMSQVLELSMQLTGISPDSSPMSDDILDNLTRPLAITEDGHVEKAGWLSELLDTDEMVEKPPLVRSTVQMLIMRHFEAKAQQELQMQQLAQKVQMQLQNEQAMNQAGMQNAQNQEMQAQQAQMQNQQAAQQQQEQNTQSEADHQRQMELEGLKQQGAIVQKAVGNSQTAGK